MASGDILVDYSTDTAPALSFDRGHCWYNYSLGSFPNNHRIILTVDPRNKVSDLAELLVFTPVENSFLSMVRPSVSISRPTKCILIFLLLASATLKIPKAHASLFIMPGYGKFNIRKLNTENSTLLINFS